ncbi:MAG: NosD domain-containing protein [Candidatus Thorarchaeota archaeon]
MRKSSLFLVIILIVGFLAGNHQLVAVDDESNILFIQQQENQAVADLIPHNPLTIVGNSELASAALAESWPGNGTALNPFVIEGYSFFNDSTCLSISDTSDYLTIRNCSFAWVGPFYYGEGILLESVINIIITNCTFNQQDSGVRIRYSSNCVVRNVTCTSLRGYGIYFLECQDILVEDNTIIGVRYGISIRYALDFGTIRRNTLINSCIYFNGDDPSHFILNATENTVNGLPFGYFYNISDTTIDMSGYGNVVVANCSNIVASNGNFVNVSISLTLAFCRNLSINNVTSRYGRIGVNNNFCTNCSLINSTFIDNTYSVLIQYSGNCRVLNNSFIGNGNVAVGVYLYEVQGIEVSENNMFTENSYIGIHGELCNDSIFNNNTIAGYSYGIQLSRTLNCNVTQNTINETVWSGYSSANTEGMWVCNNSISSNGDRGMDLYDSEGDDFGFNIIERNSRGIIGVACDKCEFWNNSISYHERDGLYFFSSLNCTIVNNTIAHNGEIGIELHSSASDFKIYRNIISENEESNAIDDGYANTWDDGISQGNIWSDYTTPPYYQIPGSAGSYDRYPSVIEDVHAPLLSVDHTPATPTSEEFVTITAQIYEVSGLSEVVLSYSIDNGITWNNFTMEQDATEWVGYIPAYAEDTLVLYTVNATDILGHSASSIIRSYTVIAVATTSTTTTDTSTTTNTTTGEDTSSNTADTNANSGVILFVGIGIASGIIVILIIEFIVKKRFD